MCALGQGAKHAIGADMKTNTLLGTTSVGGAPAAAAGFTPGTFATLLTSRGARGSSATTGGVGGSPRAPAGGSPIPAPGGRPSGPRTAY